MTTFHRIKFERRRPEKKVKSRKLREEFTFLSDHDCPFELQALVTRKISAFHEMQESYNKLIDCASLPECSKVASDVVNNYLEDRKIYDELNYYKKYHKILGHHPIFQEYLRTKKLRTMNVKELIRRQIQVDNNIWRVSSELKKNNKPELDQVRKDRLSAYQHEMEEIKRLLDG